MTKKAPKIVHRRRAPKARALFAAAATAGVLGLAGCPDPNEQPEDMSVSDIGNPWQFDMAKD